MRMASLGHQTHCSQSSQSAHRDANLLLSQIFTGLLKYQERSSPLPATQLLSGILGKVQEIKKGTQPPLAWSHSQPFKYRHARSSVQYLSHLLAMHHASMTRTATQTRTQTRKTRKTRGPIRRSTPICIDYYVHTLYSNARVVEPGGACPPEPSVDFFATLGFSIWTLIPVAVLLLLGFCFIGRRFFHAHHARDATSSLNTITEGPETSEAKKNNYPAAVKSLPDQQITRESKFVTSKFLERAAPSGGLEKVATFSCGEESVRKGTLNLEFDKDRMIAYLADGTVKLWNWRDDKENSINFGINLKDVISLQYDEEIAVLGTDAGTVHLFGAKKLEEKWSVRFGDPVDSVKFIESTLVIRTRGFRANKFWWMEISRSDMKLLNRKLVLALPTYPVSRLVRWLFPDRTDRFSESVGILLNSEYCYLYEDFLIRVQCAKSGDRITDERGNLCLLLTSCTNSGSRVTSLISTNRFLIAGCKNGTIAMWNTGELRSSRQLPIKIMEGHAGAIRSLCGLNDHLLSVDQSGKLFMWSGYDLENKDVAPVPRVLDQNFLNVSCLTGNERWFASSSSENGIINIWALPDLWLRTG